MASSENVASMMEPWAFRPNTFADSWISDAISRDTKTLTMAPQKSLSGNNPEPLDSSSADFFMPFLNTIVQTPEAAPTPTVSGLSGSDDLDSAAAPLKRQQRNAIPVANGSGKVSKRKSPASKRSQTTFITADLSNFRQMVQQVTGVRFGNGQVTMPSVLKPEPQRPGSRLAGVVGLCMPTLDTSAYLLDQPNQEPQLAGPISTRIATGPGPNTTLTGSGPVSFGPTGGVDVAPGGAVGHGKLKTKLTFESQQPSSFRITISNSKTLLVFTSGGIELIQPHLSMTRFWVWDWGCRAP
ncbi:hypothetical protein ACFX15_032603 [Malus domestica]